MRILIDTNIFVYREDNKELPPDLQKLMCILNKLHSEIIIHPRSIEDLNRDNDKERKSIILSKIRSYPLLELAPEVKNDSSFIKTVGIPSKINDDIDNSILYALYKNSVDFLITNDNGIHKKAKLLSINSRVLNVNGALERFKREMITENQINLPALKNDFIYNLNIHDPFFDSLRKDYNGFDDWFIKIAKKGRKCYVHYKADNEIGAILIYKIEDETLDSTPIMAKKKRLKLSTFKVSHVGSKIGELFIKLAVNYAKVNNVNELYLTHYIADDVDYLVELIEDYGFKKTAILNRTGEGIYLKKIEVADESVAHLNPVDISKTFYPTYYDGEAVNKFIIPIQPMWHEKLFTDYNRRRVKGDKRIKGRQPSLIEFAGQFIVEGNTIKKTYVCHSISRKIAAGDILFFYRSKDEKAITSIGIVEKIYQGMQSSAEILHQVGKRSVYSESEIEQLSQKPTLVILFTLRYHLPNPVPYDDLRNMNILKGAPQRLMQITHEKYICIKKRGMIDERFTIN